LNGFNFTRSNPSISFVGYSDWQTKRQIAMPARNLIYELPSALTADAQF